MTLYQKKVLPALVSWQGPGEGKLYAEEDGGGRGGGGGTGCGSTFEGFLANSNGSELSPPPPPPTPILGFASRDCVPEPVFFNVCGAQESILRNEFRQTM